MYVLTTFVLEMYDYNVRYIHIYIYILSYVLFKFRLLTELTKSESNEEKGHLIKN